MLSDFWRSTCSCGIVGAYKAIENGVVKGYQAVEDAVVGTYKKIEDKFVEKFLEDASEEDK